MSAYCKKEFLSDRNMKELQMLYGHISVKKKIKHLLVIWRRMH